MFKELEDKELSNDSNEDIEFTPFTLAGEDNDPDEKYSKHEKIIFSQSRIKSLIGMLAIFILIALSVALIVNTSTHKEARNNAYSSIDSLNSSIESLRNIVENNDDLKKEVADFANQQRDPTDRKNANSLSNALRAAEASDFTPIAEGQTNEQAANNVAIYFALCDLADSSSIKPLQGSQSEMMKSSCEKVTDNAYSMMSKVALWNKTRDAWYGKISLVSGKELPDVTKL